MASRLGRRIAWAVVLPAAGALLAVDLLAVRAARDAERSQVIRRMEGAAAAIAGDPRFFLSAPLDAADQGARPRPGSRVGAARAHLSTRGGYYSRDAFTRVHVPNPALAGVAQAPARTRAAKIRPSELTP